jgi:mycoredoxin
MRPWMWLLILGSLFAWQHRYDIQTFIDPPKPIAAREGLSVVLYATKWCGYCAKTRKFFEARKVPYKEYDIEHSAEGQAQYEKLGIQGVPVIIINGTVIQGYDPEGIDKALAL